MNKSQIKKELYDLPKNATFQVDKVLEWIRHCQNMSHRTKMKVVAHGVGVWL